MDEQKMGDHSKPGNATIYYKGLISQCIHGVYCLPRKFFKLDLDSDVMPPTPLWTPKLKTLIIQWAFFQSENTF